MGRKPIEKVRRRTQPLPISESFVTQCEIKKMSAALQPEGEGYQGLDTEPQLDNFHKEFADTPGTSLNGSVDDFLRSDRRSSLPQLQ